MCGICGKLEFDKDARVSGGLIKAMADTIAHRGPDDEGFYVDGQIGLGFRRLAIIDLKMGHQPLCNEDGSIWVIFNGEIYNYQDLRKELLSKGHTFKTNTDTETLVHLYEEYGENLVDKLRGMFAFALWDSKNKCLVLGRDRVGIKPLYYYLTNEFMVFGSEMKAILADPQVRREIDPVMIDRLLSFYYLPGEGTLLKNVQKLAPGHCLVFKNGQVRIRQYWDLAFPPEPRNISPVAAEEELLGLLDETVRIHMISDVPIGFLLSGGVDSTAMLSLATGKTDQAISSYTVGFCEPGITDERPYAKLAADTFGSRHRDITITSQEFADFLPKYTWHMEEPVCEPPAVALYYVSKYARQFVTVLISGEGGDEAFAGYQNYRNLLWLERVKSALPSLRGPFSSGLSLLGKLGGFSRLQKYGELMDVPFESYYYSRLASPFQLFNQVATAPYSPEFAAMLNKPDAIRAVTRYLQTPQPDILSKMLYVDTKSWLPDDLLLKADKITMASSLELRVPLLDHKVLEFAASLPSDLKVRHFTTKYIAKKAFAKRIPASILNRRKTGFPVPYAQWLRTDLHDWVSDVLLDPRSLARYFDRKAIENLIHQNQQYGFFSKEIFCLVALELWHRIFLESESSRSWHEASLAPNGKAITIAVQQQQVQ